MNRKCPRTEASKEASALSRLQVAAPTEDWTRLCLRFVRKMWGLPMVYGTAREAWQKAEKKHPYTNVHDIPHGAPVFSRPVGDETGAWHVFIAGGYWKEKKNGRIVSTRIFRSNDIKEIGSIHPVEISTFVERWGHEILGWTEDLNGYDLDLPKPPSALLKKKKGS